MKKLLARGYLAVLLVILYAPILIIAVFSFTEAKVLGNWTGFSTKLYESLFTGGLGSSMVRAIENTITIGLLAALCSTILGSIAAVGIHNMRGRKRKAITFLNDIPMLNPDIITGISLFILFVAIGMSQGYLTVLLAHISFCTPYVVLTVMPRLRMMNPNIYEAALDLGATPSQALRKVIIPQIRPAMVSGFILAFTLSIDDFAVTLFTKGNMGLETLSTYIYADARKGGLTPEIRPLMTLIFLAVLALLIIINIRSARNNKQKAAEMYMTGCAGGDVDACNNIGWAYANGSGVPKDLNKALQYYRFACDAGSQLGCYNLGLLGNANNIYGINANSLNPVDLNYVACNAGDIVGCANLGWIYAQGLDGAPINYGLAAQYFNTACIGGVASSCNNLGVLYEQGRGLTQNAGQALEMYSLACEAGLDNGCQNYKNLKAKIGG